MTDLIERLIALALAHRGWVGPAVGLLAFGESLAVVGMIIPATPALFLLGALLGSGQLDPVVVLPWAIAGAITGYWLSWRVGRGLGGRVYRAGLLAGHRRGIARTRLFFRRWGGPSLIFGRFVLGPFQSMLPLVAGVAAMATRRFHAWNVASGVIWVFVVLTPGYLAAQGVTLFGIDAAHQRLAALILLAVSGALALTAIAAATIRVLGGSRRSLAEGARGCAARGDVNRRSVYFARRLGHLVSQIRDPREIDRRG